MPSQGLASVREAALRPGGARSSAHPTVCARRGRMRRRARQIGALTSHRGRGAVAAAARQPAAGRRAGAREETAPSRGNGSAFPVWEAAILQRILRDRVIPRSSCRVTGWSSAPPEARRDGRTATSAFRRLAHVQGELRPPTQHHPLSRPMPSRPLSPRLAGSTTRWTLAGTRSQLHTWSPRKGLGA